MMFRRFRVKTGEQDIFDADGNVVGKEPVYGRVWKRKVVDVVTGNVSWQTVNLKDYSFGRGVYRSSYKNAMRLARTETNMAYRTADQERWRQLDFVIGYRVVLSDNHPEPDICNDLSAKRGEKGSRGVYPKDFVFKGWHPQCRCYVVPILADEKEFDKIQEAILNDEPIPESKSVIREPNKYFQDWWKSNKSRVAEAQSLPYWVKDNSRMLGINGKRSVKEPLPQDVKNRRKILRQLANEKLVGKEFSLPQIGEMATISKRGVKEWLNQPFFDVQAKNEALLDLQNLLKKSVYRGKCIDRHDNNLSTYLFETSIKDKKCWIIVRNYYEGEYSIYSISDSGSILNMIK